MNNKTRQKKRYGLLLVFLVLNWLALGLVMWKVEPDTIKDFVIPGIYLPMLFLVFGALFLLFSVLFLSAKRALRWSLGATFFLGLRFSDLGSLLNGSLILGILGAIEFYLAKNEPKKEITEAG